MENFSDLLTMAKSQPDAQRLLMVFVAIDGNESNENPQGGYLTPIMCVDKTPDEIVSFESLLAESDNTGQKWDLVFVGALSGKGSIAPSNTDANKPLDAMIAKINMGMVSDYLAFNKQGEILEMTPNSQ
ncbi:MAG: ribonucleotide reductase subunit alpha [Cellvibrio sp.]|nr:ribonucleotide reductase subunit alpha [Cellvibrio sp.]